MDQVNQGSNIFFYHLKYLYYLHIQDDLIEIELRADKMSSFDEANAQLFGSPVCTSSSGGTSDTLRHNSKTRLLQSLNSSDNFSPVNTLTFVSSDCGIEEEEDDAISNNNDEFSINDVRHVTPERRSPDGRTFPKSSAKRSLSNKFVAQGAKKQVSSYRTKGYEFLIKILKII